MVQARQASRALHVPALPETVQPRAPALRPKRPQRVGGVRREAASGDAQAVGAAEVAQHGAVLVALEDRVLVRDERVGERQLARRVAADPHRGGGEAVQGFELAGADRRFHPATAKLEGDAVVVTSDLVAQPVAVRYAWRDNPENANLTNREKLPASPFRSDAW